MRIGLLGGTFDPPHAGHLHMAKVAEDLAGLDRVLFAPCNHQPLKAAPPVASGAHRAAMVALAIRDKKNWLLETSELDRGGLSYTAETLETLRLRFPDDALFLVLGGDSYASLPQWLRFMDIVREAGLVVIPRDPSAIAEEAIQGAWVLRATCAPVAVSSTEVRARLADSRPIRGLVPAAVASYIQRQGLYGPATPATTQRRRT